MMHSTCAEAVTEYIRFLLIESSKSLVNIGGSAQGIVCQQLENAA
jgi:hypothetical protein